MERVRVDTPSRGYDVLVGGGLLAELGTLVRVAVGTARCCVITETNVAPLYAEAAEESLRAGGLEVAERIVFPAGEANKTLATLGVMLEGLAARELTRDGCVVALGGGVTGDMAGLAAALYLRGIDIVQVPTSLLAMVDSSVGGKTAVDLPAGKNLVGAFWQPRLVVADVTTLGTVEPELLRDSCGEVIKHAVLADAALLDELTSRLISTLRATTCARHAPDPQPGPYDRPRHRGGQRFPSRPWELRGGRPLHDGASVRSTQMVLGWDGSAHRELRGGTRAPHGERPSHRRAHAVCDPRQEAPRRRRERRCPVRDRPLRGAAREHWRAARAHRARALGRGRSCLGACPRRKRHGRQRASIGARNVEKNERPL